MKTKLLIILVLICLLPACSTMNSHATDVDLIVQHDALIKHFEEEAEQIQIKIGEHKKTSQPKELCLRQARRRP